MSPAQQLYEAVRAGDVAVVRELVLADPSLLKGGGAAGMPPLMLAVYNRQQPVIEVLLANGAEVDLHAAAALGNVVRLSELLAENPSAIDQHTSDGWTALHLACFFGHKEVAEFLISKGADVKVESANAMRNMPLHAAAAGRNAEICAILLSAGAPVNARQNGGYSALHSAAANGDDILVRLLLAHQADTTAGSQNNEKPADLARAKGFPAIAELIEKAS